VGAVAISLVPLAQRITRGDTSAPAPAAPAMAGSVDS